jgi:tRNA (guanine6-N2)-methyltransferase
MQNLVMSAATLSDSYAMTMPGLETVAYSEIKSRLPAAELIKFARGIVLFRSGAPIKTLLKVRTSEDVFVMLRHITHLGRSREAVRVLHSATLQADSAQALSLWRVARHASPRTWRVVSQKRGEHDFRRVDAAESVADALRRALPHSLHQVEDGADLEFWVSINGSEAFIGLRLSDATMRQSPYRREHRPASLHPTVAAAMGWLSLPTTAERVLAAPWLKPLLEPFEKIEAVK